MTLSLLLLNNFLKKSDDNDSEKNIDNFNNTYNINIKKYLNFIFQYLSVLVLNFNLVDLYDKIINNIELLKDDNNIIKHVFTFFNDIYET
jgi:hypothetical protein